MFLLHVGFARAFSTKLLCASSLKGGGGYDGVAVCWVREGLLNQTVVARVKPWKFLFFFIWPGLVIRRMGGRTTYV